MRERMGEERFPWLHHRLFKLKDHILGSQDQKRFSQNQKTRW